jgi:hypothetical protein
MTPLEVAGAMVVALVAARLLRAWRERRRSRELAYIVDTALGGVVWLASLALVLEHAEEIGGLLGEQARAFQWFLDASRVDAGAE